MYRPDYYAPASRGVRWAPLLTLGLFIGLFGAGLVNGWWGSFFANKEDKSEDAGAQGLPAAIAATSSPRILDPVAAAKATNPTHSSASDAAPPTATSATVALDEQAPDFTLPDLFDEQTVYTLSAYRGRPVILNFWASWCVPCRREMPALQAIAARYAEDGLFVLGMNQTYIDDLDSARAFVEELGLTFPNSRDDRGLVGSDSYRVVGIPTSVFINAEGEVVHLQIGEMSLEQMAAYTERLIVGQPLQP